MHSAIFRSLKAFESQCCFLIFSISRHRITGRTSILPVANQRFAPQTEQSTHFKEKVCPSFTGVVLPLLCFSSRPPAVVPTAHLIDNSSCNLLKFLPCSSKSFRATLSGEDTIKLTMETEGKMPIEKDQKKGNEQRKLTVKEQEEEKKLKKEQEMEEKIGPAPEKPLPGDCCGQGCDVCVWDTYWEDFEEYKKLRKAAEESG